MSKTHGILLVSHVPAIADGLKELLSQVAADVTIISAGGTDENEIGTSFDKISQGLESFEEERVLAFYDLGSAKMNLEMAMEVATKKVTLYDTAFVESAYTAASLLQADAPIDMIEEQVNALKVK
ncbi:dihydroxyacetone kinase phosphoryl donor subunit DhaM [Pisciglobus halotolerans]|uniref:phosphoenolpyruvate--glycerone phosphotransferase n=1 Tax=Pisciglobus halotolerans TaxID=745365 RepID=A0A1I3DRP8_9LACT|nr:dihydroxyacetone kinase phosphoryl donor subunit DhaM [Pisciglobus halotolerans]SFH89228.1 dihydroxyacetone kinase, phosphotransfer subunit [Pisciglobus halotolerans]